MLKLFGMKNIFIFITSLFLICCQSQRYNIKEEKNVIIPTDIVTFYFPLHRINQYVVEYTMKYSNGDKPEYLGEYVFHVDAPSYRIDVVKESSLVINFMFDEALYGITRMIDKNEAIVIENETRKKIKYKMKLHIASIGGEGHSWLETTDSNGRLLLTIPDCAAYDHFISRKKAIKHE